MSRRKINKFAHLRIDPHHSTSETQLKQLANEMGFDIQTGRITDLDKLTADKLILNTDKYGPGRHWVAVDRQKNEYFDPYAYDGFQEVPRNLKLASRSKQLQSLNAKDCGLLCLAWLANPVTENFMKQFEDVYYG